MSQRNYFILVILAIIIIAAVWWWLAQAPVIQAPAGANTATSDGSAGGVRPAPAFDSTATVESELNAVIIGDLEADFADIDRDLQDL